MLKLKFCFASFRFKYNLVKERLFTLQTTLSQCQSLAAVNSTLQAFLSEKIHDQVQAMKFIGNSPILTRIKEEVEQINNSDDLLLENTIKYLEVNIMKPDFKEDVNWLLNQPICSEYQQILLMQFFSGLLVNDKEIYQQFKQNKKGDFNTLLVQIIEYSIQKKKQPALSEEKEAELRSSYLNHRNDTLKCYASLFLSKYSNEITEYIECTCHPEILLIILSQEDITDTQLKFTLSQIQQGVNQWNMFYLAQLLIEINKYRASEQFISLIQQIYVQRVFEQEANKQFNFRVLKNFVQVAQKNEAFGDYQVYMRLLKRLVHLLKESNYQEKTFENVLRALYFALRELSIKNTGLFEDIPKILLTQEFSEVKQDLEEWLKRTNLLESISIVNMFQLQMPDGFCERYLASIHLSEKLLRSIVRLLNQSTIFQLNDVTCKLLEEYINQFKIDYVRYLQPANLILYDHNLVQRIVKAIITNSNDDSIIEYISKNVTYLRNNKKVCQDIGMDFSHMAPYIKFLIEAQFTLTVDLPEFCRLVSIYSIMGEFDEAILDKIKGLISTLDSGQIANILAQSEELRIKLQDFHSIKQLSGENNYINIYLNKTGQIPNTISTIDEILIAQSKCLNLPYYKSKQLKIELLKKLEACSEVPSPQQSYELLLGWRAADFSPETYSRLLKIVKDGLQSYDCHHIYKLINKLVMQHQIQPSIMLQAYLKIQQIAKSELSEQPDKVSFIRLAILLKRIYPTLVLELQEQKSEESLFIKSILENIYYQNQKHFLTAIQPYMPQYIEFFPLFYNEQPDFSSLFSSFQDKLEASIFGQVNGIKFEVDSADLLAELDKPPINVVKQVKLACLIDQQSNNMQFKEKLKRNFTHLDPNTNYLFQDDLIVCLEVMKKLFPNQNVLKKIEQFVVREYDSFYEPTLSYLLTESLLTVRTISMLEEKCLQ